MGCHSERHQLAVSRGGPASALVLLAAGAMVALVTSTTAVRGVLDHKDESSQGVDLAPEARDSLEALGDSEGLPVARDLLDQADAVSHKSELVLEKEASDLLEEYRRRGDCVVAQSGYLDLLGETWGCVMQGEGWVEICLVRRGAEDARSDVAVWHIDAEDVAAVCGLEEGPV